jgi:glycosyltransferase 2 family protein
MPVTDEGVNRRGTVFPKVRGRVPAPKTAVVWIGIAIGVVFTYFAVRDIRLSEIRDALQTCNYVWLVPAVAALAVATLMRAYRWQLLFFATSRPPFIPVLRAMLIGQFFNNILPARAGEAARVVALNESSQTSRAESLATVLVERALDVVCVLALLFLLLPWLPHIAWLGGAAVLAGVLAGAMLAVVALIATMRGRVPPWMLRALGRLPFVSLARAEQASSNFLRGLAMLRSWRLAVAAVSLTIASWGVLGLSAWFVMRGFDLGLSPAAGVLVMIAIALAMILPSLPAAVGVFEAATIVALDPYDLPTGQALSYALVLHAVNFFPYLVAGFVILQSHALPLRQAQSG